MVFLSFIPYLGPGHPSLEEVMMNTFEIAYPSKRMLKECVALIATTYTGILGV